MANQLLEARPMTVRAPEQEEFHVEPSKVVDHPSRGLQRIAEPEHLPMMRPVPHFSIGEMKEIAMAIAQGGLFGSNDPNAVLTLCMLAHAEGQHPAVVFRDYNIIKGRPSKTAEAMQRDFLLAGGKIKWHELTNDIADATFSHPQGGSARISWDWERCEEAGLLEPDRSGGCMHKKYPRQMKRARTISEGVRTIWPAATGGMYEPGEVQDIVDEVPGDRKLEHKGEKRKPPTAEELVERRKNAEKFTENQIAAVQKIETHEALTSLQATTRKEVKALASRHPDLYATIQLAFEQKEMDLNGYDPVTGKKKDEPVEDEGAPTDVFSVFERRLGECQGPKDVDKVDRDWCKVRVMHDDETIELVDDLMRRRRASFERS